MFKKAERRGQKIKFAITGPSGSGKTTAALKMARGLVGPKGKIAVIDTENGSASLYSDVEEFDVCDLEAPYDQRKFEEAIRGAEAAGYDLLIIDSFSHVWEAILNYKDKLDSRGGNSFTNWGKATQEFKYVLDALLQSKMHICVCMRAKMEHVIEEIDGKRSVKKVGLAPIMRDGIEFEFTVVFDLDMSHVAASSKDRTRLFDGTFQKLDRKTGGLIRGWLDGAAPPIEKAPLQPKKEEESQPESRRRERSDSDDYVKPEDDGEPIPFEMVQKINQAWKALGKSDDQIKPAIAWTGNLRKAEVFEGLTKAEGEMLLRRLQEQMNSYAEKQAVPPEGSRFEQEEIPAIPDPLRLWFESHEEKINSYLKEIQWIEDGKTWRSLSEQHLNLINTKTESFAKNCGVSIPEAISA